MTYNTDIFKSRLSFNSVTSSRSAKKLEHLSYLFQFEMTDSNKMNKIGFDLFKDDKVSTFFDECPGYNPYDKTIINLAAGSPGPDLFEPLPRMFDIAMQHRMRMEKVEGLNLFQYGPSAGLWGMREALASFLTKNYGSKVNRESLVLTCGATHGLHLLVSTVMVPNGVIFVEEYTYALALQVLKEFGNHRIVPVPLKDNIVDVEKFKEIASRIKGEQKWETSEDKPFWAMFYTIPTFHNPTGSLLPPDECKSLLKVARELDLLLVCDDVYNLVYFGNKSPIRLFAYDDINSPEYKGGNVVSNSTFSKIMCTGIRVGWMEVPPRLALKFRHCGIMQSGGAVNNVMFGVVQSLLELGLAQKQLNWFQKVYKHRMETVCNVLRKNLPPNCKFVQPQGGYFLWVEIPCDASLFLDWCREKGGPIAVPAAHFRWTALTKFEYSPALRISIGFQNADTLKSAVEDLVNKLKMFLNDPARFKIDKKIIKVVNKL